MAIEYRILVDWDGDGTLSEIAYLSPWQPIQQAELEDISAYVRANPGISTVRGRDQIRALAPPMAGSADVDLDNQERYFSPENSSSPIYGYLIPGRKIQVQASESGTVYYLWTGYLDDIPQHPARDQRSVSLPSLGPFSRLAGKKASTALYQSIRTDEAIGYLLDAIGWPAGDRVLDTGKTTLNDWWLQEEDAFTALVTLMNTEGPGAAIYEDGEGSIVFESRHYRLTTSRSTTSQATISDTGTEPLFSAPFSYNPGLKDIINVAQVEVKTRETAGSYTVVWSVGQTVTLAANEVRQYVAVNTDPFTDALTPVDATDYILTSGSLASITLDRTSGQSCTMTITAGSAGASVTALQLRAKLVSVTATTLIASTVDTSTSISRYGRQVYNLSLRAEIATSVAQDLVNAIVGRYQEPRPTVALELNNATSERITQILNREISDRVTYVEAQTGVNHDYHIERIGHKIDEAGLFHRVAFGAEKASTVNYFILDTSELDTGVVGY